MTRTRSIMLGSVLLAAAVVGGCKAEYPLGRLPQDAAPLLDGGPVKPDAAVMPDASPRTGCNLITSYRTYSTSVIGPMDTTYTITDPDSNQSYSERLAVTQNLDGSKAITATFRDSQGSGLPPSVENSRLKVVFMSPIGAATPQEYVITQTNGSGVVLAIEEAHAVLITSDKLAVSCYAVVFNGVNQGTQPISGMFGVEDTVLGTSVLDLSGSPLAPSISSGSTDFVIVAQNARPIIDTTLPIKVYKLAPTYTLPTNWADMAVLSTTLSIEASADRNLSINNQGQPFSGGKMIVAQSQTDAAGNLTQLQVVLPPDAILAYYPFF
ncbi:hypothetical protein HZC07_00735 [Candidatus Micrarchaeota archaeon]|nr:hypothetical protein [Candidatus Micrarchaeota archaeon]